MLKSRGLLHSLFRPRKACYCMHATQALVGMRLAEHIVAITIDSITMLSLDSAVFSMQ